jgi:Ca2+-binding EF-hand superfamily protein
MNPLASDIELLSLERAAERTSFAATGGGGGGGGGGASSSFNSALGRRSSSKSHSLLSSLLEEGNGDGGTSSIDPAFHGDCVVSSSNAREQLEPGAWKAIREIFKLLDRRRTGEVEMEVLAQVVGAAARSKTEDVVKEFRRAAAAPAGTTHITVEEFCVW